MTKRALVLAGGGLAGIAWQTGILRGITDEARGGPARGDVAGNRRLLRWLDIHMGPVTWQVLDQVGHKSALRLLRRAHATAGHVLLDGPKFRADPTATTTDHPNNPQAIAAGRNDLQALDAWVHHYNTEIPHQSLGMCPPAERIALAAPGPDLQVVDPIAAVVAHAQTRARLLRQWSIVVRL